MHQLLRLITMTLALTAAALAFADMPAMKAHLPTTRIEPAQPDGDLHKQDGAGAEQAVTAQPVPDVSMDQLCDTLAASAHKSGLPVSRYATSPINPSSPRQ